MDKKIVVVVEDDATIRENLQEFLESEGLEVQVATNGQEGLAVIRKLKGYCLVLLDLQMPVMTGEEVLAELARDPDPKIAATSIIIITARAEPLKFKVHSFLKKPLDLDLLLETVRKFM